MDTQEEPKRIITRTLEGKTIFCDEDGNECERPRLSDSDVAEVFVWEDGEIKRPQVALW